MSLIPALDPSIDGKSPLHEADPRLKLVGLVAFVVTASLLPQGASLGYTALLVLVAAAFALCRLPIVRVLRRAAPALLFATGVAFSALLQARGEEYVAVRVLWLRVAIGPYGVGRFLDVLARTWLCGLTIGVHVAVTPFRDMVLAMRALGVPEMMTSVLAMTYRYLAVLLDEGERMARARESRTLLTPSLLRLGSQARAFGSMLGSLFLRAHGRSERVYAAMLSRGYQGDMPALVALRWCRRDTLLLLAWGAGLAVAMVASLPGWAS